MFCTEAFTPDELSGVSPLCIDIQRGSNGLDASPPATRSLVAGNPCWFELDTKGDLLEQHGDKISY